MQEKLVSKVVVRVWTPVWPRKTQKYKKTLF